MVEDRSSDRREGESTAFWLAIAALTLVGVWTNLVGYGSDVVPDAGNVTPFARIGYCVGTAACGALFLAQPRSFSQRVIAYWVVALVAGAASITFVMAYRQTLLSPMVSASVACLCLGFAHLWLVAEVYLFLASRFEDRRAIVAIAVSLALEILFTPLLGGIDSSVFQLALSVAMPLAAAALFTYVDRSFGGRAGQQTGNQTDSGGQVIALSAQTAVAAAAVVVLQALTSPGVWGTNRYANQSDAGSVALVLASIALFALIAYLSFALPKRRDPIIRFIPAFAILITGFFVLALSSDSSTFMVRVVAQALEGFSHLLLWSVVVCGMYRSDVPFRYVGIVGVVHGTLSAVWLVALQGAENITAVLLFAGMYVLVILVLMLIYRMPRAELHDDAAAQKASVDAAADRLARIAAEHGLSERETEVLALLAQGKSRKQIADEICVAESTVKTHTAHIYKKLGIGSKSELLRLFLEG